MTESTNPTRTVRLARTELGRYTATNERGLTLELGHADDLFTPVELLLAAVAGCSAIDVDHITTRRSEPETFDVTAASAKITDETGGHRLGDIAVDFRLTFPDTEEGRAAAAVVERSVAQSRDRLCTVSRTVAAPTTVAYAVDGKDLA